MITLHEISQGSPEWLAIRENLYTGSNAHKLLEHSQKTKIIDGVTTAYASGETSSFKGNFYTKRGHVLEDQAIELYESIRNIYVQKVGFVTNTDYPNCGYSPDGLLDDRTLEVKSFKKDLHLKLVNGDLNIKILAQIHFGMLICGVKLCDFIAYNPDFAKKQLTVDSMLVDNPDYNPKNAFKIITIKYNPAIANNFKRVLA